MKKIEFFKIEGDRINRFRRHCPKCGPGLFLADHNNRFSCGKCGYTEFKVGSRKEPQPPKVEEKPIEQPVEKKLVEEDKSIEESSEEKIKESTEKPTEKVTSEPDKQSDEEKKENTSESKEKPDEK